MNYEKVLKGALGDTWQEHSEIGIKILDYVSANPDWDKATDIEFEREWEIFNECVINVLGHPVSFYFQKCRERWLVDNRRMLLVVYREVTDRPWKLVQQKFPMNRASLIHLLKTWREYTFDKELVEQYREIKEQFIERLNNEKSN